MMVRGFVNLLRKLLEDLYMAEALLWPAVMAVIRRKRTWKINLYKRLWREVRIPCLGSSDVGYILLLLLLRLFLFGIESIVSVGHNAS